MSPSPRLAVLLTLGLLLTACGTSGGDRSAGSSDGSGGVDGPGAGSALVTEGVKEPCVLSRDLPGGDVASADRNDALFFPWELDAASVTRVDGFDENAIRSGGPPPDGIRPIEHEEACFDTLADGDRFLTPQAPVMVVQVGEDIRAYPLGIMTQHEIVNDVIGGVPTLVTYCPLCNSGLAFERTVGQEVLSFGTSGRLFQSNLVMYDRQHHNLWSQFDGRAVVGSVDDDLTGTRLVRLPTSLLGWAEFKELAPDGLVLSPDVGPTRNYNRNPYPGYDLTGINYGLFTGPQDDTLPANTRVVGVGADRDPVAIALPRLMDERVVTVTIDGEPVSVWWAPGASSALDAGTVDGGQDVGQTMSVIARAPDGRTLDFSASPEDESVFVDSQTGSRWNLFGEAIDGELAGTRLEHVPRDDTFWFVWFAFQPDTTVAV